MKTYQSFSTRSTPQSEPVPGKNMAQNNAGGYVFAVDDWKRLERFLILGSEGGTYYVDERKLTADNAECVLRCIKADGKRVVDIIARISFEGRAPKNDPALFALAMCAAAPDEATRKYALEALPRIARIGTHLFHFVAFVEQFRGWGRGLTSAIAAWYNTKPANDLAYQLTKYQARDGWSHRDLLRLSHPKATSKDHAFLYRYMTTGWENKSGKDGQVISGAGELANHLEGDAVLLVQAIRELHSLASESSSMHTISLAAKLIAKYRLTREMIPTELLKSPTIWEAMLEHMPMTAMIRNLATMTRIGLIAPLANATQFIANTIRDTDKLQKARVHPIALLAALKTYEQGHGERGKHTWNPVSQIVDALNDAFYLAFKAITPTGKRWLLALDVSGSMAMERSKIAGIPGLYARDASAAMALVTAATEQQYHVMGFGNTFIPLSISPKQRLDNVIRSISNLPFSSTDCSLPMLWAKQNNVPVDVFTVYTDNETWLGQVHPFQALEQYRQKTGIGAKLIVVGMVATNFSIANPDDAGMLDVVGFDTAAPQLMSEFAIG